MAGPLYALGAPEAHPRDLRALKLDAATVGAIANLFVSAARNAARL
jgi:hypothetical protein